MLPAESSDPEDEGGGKDQLREKLSQAQLSAKLQLRSKKNWELLV